MSGEEFEELRGRVARLEAEVAELRLERGVVFSDEPRPVPSEPKPVAAPPVVPPPPLVAPPPLVVRVADVEDLPRAGVSFDVRADAPRSMEDRLGSQWFSRIGIATLLIATALFLKLSIDRHWIGPVGRILVGLIAGAGLILWSERFRRQGISAFSYALKAIGTGVLYLTLWAAFQLYHLLPAPVALGAMVLVTAWNAFMAWSQGSELLAGYALSGGLATPLLLSTGGNHEVFLFTYLLAIDLATVLLVRLRAWPRLLVGAVPATVTYFIGWYVSFYAARELGTTAVFLVLFGAAFVLGSVDLPGAPPLPRERGLENTLGEILLPLANAVFVSLGLYSVLQDAGHHGWLPWLMLGLAAVYLGVMRLRQGMTAAAVHLSLAVVFLTIAIPLKASGRWITVAWLVEGVALYWVAGRVAATTKVLRGLAVGALVLGFVAVAARGFWFDGSLRPDFFNRDLGTALVGVAAFGMVAWMALRREDREAAVAAVAAVEMLGVLLTLREVATARFNGALHPGFLNADFGMAAVGAGVLAGAAGAMLRLRGREPEQAAWGSLGSCAVVGFNLLVVLSCTREIGSLWTHGAGLEQALAVSAFLMVYSAGLLAAGFWRRTAFVRWQGLGLLVFTIAKTFVYDTSSLSQEYRVASFLGLGVLLMGVSFAYQKDWLGLREPAPEPKKTEAPQ